MTDLESRVAALEQDMAEVKAELTHFARFQPVEESVDTIANDLLLSAVRDARDKVNADK